MFEILSITVPIYLVIAVGYLATKAGLFEPGEMRVLGRFVLNLALPALLIHAIAGHPVREVIDPAYALTYAFGSMTLLCAGYLWLRRVSGLGHGEASTDVMGMVCPNSGFVGYPLLLLLDPAIAGKVLGLNMMVENFLVIPILLTMAEAAGRQGKALDVLIRSLAGALRSPIVIGIGIGLLLSILEVRPPVPVARAVDLFANASAALSLFVIGGTLVGIPLAGIGGRASRIVLGKLILHPLAMLMALVLLPGRLLPPLDPAMAMALMITGALPIMGIYTILAQRHGDGRVSAVALLSTSILSFVTLNLLLLAIPLTGLP